MARVPRVRAVPTATAGPLYSAGLVDILNDVTQLHAHLPHATTPQRVYDALADGHAQLMVALRALKEAEGYQGRHRDSSPESVELDEVRDTLEQTGYAQPYQPRHGVR